MSSLFFLYIYPAPHGNICQGSWALKGPQSSIGHFHCPEWTPLRSLSAITPWWNSQYRILVCVFSGKRRGLERMYYGRRGASQLETDVLVASKHQPPTNPTQHKHRHVQIGYIAAVAANTAKHCLHPIWVAQSNIHAEPGSRPSCGALTHTRNQLTMSGGPFHFFINIFWCRTWKSPCLKRKTSWQEGLFHFSHGVVI